MYCQTCGPPLPGRGYDGHTVKTSQLRSILSAEQFARAQQDGGINIAPNYIERDDCGNFTAYPGGESTTLPRAGQPVSVDTPFVQFDHNTTAAFPSYTNAYCELNQDLSCANAMVNRDYTLFPKSVVSPMGFSLDYS
jgi:hypothetical protein